MNTVTEIYLSKLNEAQARMDECAARAGLTAPRFSRLLSEAAVTQSVPVDVNAAAGTSYDGWIQQAASANGLDPDLVRAVIQTESGFRADAQSGAGAQGLMQLMPSTAKSLGVTDAFDPQQNIEAGTKYLSNLVQRFGDLRLALAAYNTGPGHISDLNISDPDNAAEYVKISERVRGYVSKVLSRYDTYNAI